MHTIVTLKAFGDFVIAASALKRFRSKAGHFELNLVAGEHVRLLAGALGLGEIVQFVGDRDLSDVPAAFDIKNRGWFSGVKSIGCLHNQLNELELSSALVFDRLGWRERLIGVGHTLYNLPKNAENIYIAYDRFFTSLGYEARNESLPRSKTCVRTIIIPGARMSTRIIPKFIIKKICCELASRGIETKVLLLEHESIDVPPDVTTERIPRRFESLVSSVNSADLVISADSLPSHLGAFLDVPVFIFTPTPIWSSYWLPLSAHYSKGMASFEDIRPFYSWLDLNSNGSS